MLLLSIYIGVKWIKWDAAVVFHEPNESDFNSNPSVLVSDVNSSRWKEKASFLIETSEEACNKNYEIILNKNLKILNVPISESFVYICSKQQELINLEINEYVNEKPTRLQCNDTYANQYRLIKRKHPVNFSWYGIDGVRRQNITSDYKDTCIIYNSLDLLNSEWYV
tara:strand:+ start:247 stop:747 length:501 start_codon:yes stop_codon:yes gene_type:complete